MRDFSRYNAFLDGLIGDVYPEPPTEPHIFLTTSTIQNLVEEGMRAGFSILRSLTINFTPNCGPDIYWSFLLRRNI